MSSDDRLDDLTRAGSSSDDRARWEHRGGPSRVSLRALLGLLPAMLALAGWWKLREQLYIVHWEEGPTVFLLIVASVALVLAVPRLAGFLARSRRTGSSVPSADRPERRQRWLLLAALLAVLALRASADELADLRTTLARENPRLIDIGGATWAAARRFFDYGQNPYTNVTQLQRISPGPGVTETPDGRIEMFGVPYHYGFPYFPAMFLAFAPFRWIDASQDAIRIGNAFWLVILLVAVGWLAWRLAPRSSRALAASLAALLLTTTAGLGGQLFQFGITDLVIPVFVLLGLLALSYRWYLLAGVAIGLAFSAKLLPAVLIVLVFFAWLARRGGLRPAALGFIAATLVVMLPFVVWSPSGFLSATFLFYLTHHTGGDTTSLWYYLPQSLRLPFQLVGGLATLTVALSPLWARSDDERDLLRAMVVAPLLFLASGPMIHLNYQFAVVPLACIALATDAMGPLESAVRREVDS